MADHHETEGYPKFRRQKEISFRNLQIAIMTASSSGNGGHDSKRILYDYDLYNGNAQKWIGTKIIQRKRSKMD